MAPWAIRSSRTSAATASRNRDDDCDILARSFCGEAIEWRSTEEGQSCMAYAPLGERLPEAPCPHTSALDLGAQAHPDNKDGGANA